MRVVEVASATRAETGKQSQDRILQLELGAGYYCLAAFDGLGHYGAQIAEEVKAITEQAVSDQETPHTNAINVQGAWADYNADLQEDQRALQSGTQAAAVLINKDDLAKVWIGDSGANFYPNDGPRVPLIQPHDIYNDQEVTRIGKTDVNLAREMRRLRFDPAFNTPTRYFGMYDRRHCPQTAMGQPPEVGRHTLYRPGIIVVGTDGLFGKNKAPVATIGSLIQERTGDLQELADKLVDFCSLLNHDDCSVLLARVEE